MYLPNFLDDLSPERWRLLLTVVLPRLLGSLKLKKRMKRKGEKTRKRVPAAAADAAAVDSSEETSVGEMLREHPHGAESTPPAAPTPKGC